LALYGCDDDLGLALQAKQIRANEQGGVDFNVIREGQGILGEVSLQIPGRHNVLNALAALLVTEELGVALSTASAALAEFTGMARRFEQLGKANGVTVIDDYAHHPTQIRAVLAAARQRYPGKRVIAVWQPHTFSRVKALREAFMTAFTDADYVLVLPIYAAREIDDGSISHHDLAQNLCATAQEDHETTAVNTLEEAAQTLVSQVQPGDIVILMGAGDEYIVGQQLLAML
jgi:UDP-N-acetylmuramate--alanine ligase